MAARGHWGSRRSLNSGLRPWEGLPGAAVGPPWGSWGAPGLFSSPVWRFLLLLGRAWGRREAKKEPSGVEFSICWLQIFLLSWTILDLLACFVVCYAVALCWLLGWSMFTSFRALRKKHAYALRPTKTNVFSHVFYVSFTWSWPPSALARKDQEAKNKVKTKPQQELLTTTSSNFRTSLM